MNLYKLELNRRAIVKRINLPNDVRERLHSVGVIEGIDIILKKKSPLRSPQIYEVMSTQIAIRNNIARNIQIYRLQKEITRTKVSNK